ncbi:MAG: hypothetical protein J6P38_01825 [Acetobacter sp.]|nr:hypothetical protein [Acetobacter sp.]
MVEWRQYSRYKRKNKEQIKKDKQKEARFVGGFFLTVQLDHFGRMCLVSRFGFDLTFRTTDHDP